MDLRYFLGALLALPLLPLLYLQGRRIRRRVPRLPEARGPEGVSRPGGPAARTLRLVALGESTIAGVGVATHREGFTGSLAGELARRWQVGVAWRVYARSGYTARRVLTELVPTIDEPRVDLFVIGLGGNDAFTLNRPARWRRAVRALIEALRDRYPEAVLVFCNMPPIKEFPAFTPLIKWTVGNLVERLGEDLGAVAAEYERVLYFGERITLQAWMERYRIAGRPADFFSDGVHPSRLTYQTWARDIARRLAADEGTRTTLLPGAGAGPASGT